MRIYKTVCYEIFYEISAYFIWIAQYHTEDYTYRVQRHRHKSISGTEVPATHQTYINTHAPLNTHSYSNNAITTKININLRSKLCIWSYLPDYLMWLNSDSMAV